MDDIALPLPDSPRIQRVETRKDFYAARFMPGQNLIVRLVPDLRGDFDSAAILLARTLDPRNSKQEGRDHIEERTGHFKVTLADCLTSPRFLLRYLTAPAETRQALKMILWDLYETRRHGFETKLTIMYTMYNNDAHGDGERALRGRLMRSYNFAATRGWHNEDMRISYAQGTKINYAPAKGAQPFDLGLGSYSIHTGTLTDDPMVFIHARPLKDRGPAPRLFLVGDYSPKFPDKYAMC